MREIKFRNWDSKTKIMHTAGIMNLKGQILDQRVEYNKYCCEEQIISHIEKHQIIMQFTGLHDKNGKEIFEGDIVNFKDLEHNEGWKKAKIIYKEFGTRFVAMTEYGECQFYGDKYTEVIGNIYENGDLLK